MPESGISQFRNWIENHSFDNVYNAITAHDKSSIFQAELLEALNKFLPEKTTTFSSDDQAWCTPEIKEID